MRWSSGAGISAVGVAVGAAVVAVAVAALRVGVGGVVLVGVGPAGSSVTWAVGEGVGSPSKSDWQPVRKRVMTSKPDNIPMNLFNVHLRSFDKQEAKFYDCFKSTISSAGWITGKGPALKSGIFLVTR